jgi:hypothetical protein
MTVPSIGELTVTSGLMIRLIAPDENAQTIACRVQCAFRRLQIGFRDRLVIARLLCVTHRGRLVGEETRRPLGLPLRDHQARARLFQGMQRRDQVGLRLHDLGTIDLE